MKNKGFTLVELLAIITLLGIISLLIVPQVESVIVKSKNKGLESQKKSILADAKSWSIDNKELIYSDDTTTFEVDLGTLKLSGYADFEIINPVTNKCISNDTSVLITKNSKNNLSYDFKTDIKDGNENDCLDKTQKPNTTDSKCFKFAETTGTIEGYNYGSCPTNIVIPAEIDGYKVEHIGDFAFAPLNYTPISLMLVSINEDPKADLYINTKSNLKEIGTIKMITDNDISKYKKKCYKFDKTYEEKPLSFNITDDFDYCKINTTDTSTIIGAPTKNVGAITGVDFTYASNLKDIGIGSFINNQISSLNFAGATKLKSIGMSAFRENKIGTLSLAGAISLYDIGNGSFEENKIATITLTDKIKNIGYFAFANNILSSVNFNSAIRLKKINSFSFLNNSITNLNLSNLPNLNHIGSEVFINNSITSIRLENLPSLKTIDVKAFSHTNSTTNKTMMYINNLEGLTNIEEGTAIFSNVTFSTIEFANMPNFKAFPKGLFLDSKIDNLYLNDIKGLETIKSGAFSNCDLLSLKLSSNLKTIGDNAFNGNNRLTSITIDGDKTRFNANWTNIGFLATTVPQ